MTEEPEVEDTVPDESLAPSLLEGPDFGGSDDESPALGRSDDGNLALFEDDDGYSPTSPLESQEQAGPSPTSPLGLESLEQAEPEDSLDLDVDDAELAQALELALAPESYSTSAELEEGEGPWTENTYSSEEPDQVECYEASKLLGISF